jgi:hypothetical protein
MTDHVAKEMDDSEVTLEELKAEQEQMLEKAQRKRLESFWWAAVFIWAGLVLVADFLDVLPEIREANAWSWIFLGAGIFGLIGALVRLYSSDLPNPTGGDYFWSGLFFVIGASGFFGDWITFPLALILVGVAILANLIFRPD